MQSLPSAPVLITMLCFTLRKGLTQNCFKSAENANEVH